MLRNEASTSKGLSGRIELQEFAARLDVVKRVWSFAYPKSKSNMNIDAFLLFLDVAADGEASSLSEISAKRGLSALTGLRLLDTVLEAGMGVIRKFEDPYDGRRSRAALTEKGIILYRILCNMDNVSKTDLNTLVESGGK